MFCIYRVSPVNYERKVQSLTESSGLSVMVVRKWFTLESYSISLHLFVVQSVNLIIINSYSLKSGYMFCFYLPRLKIIILIIIIPFNNNNNINNNNNK